MQAARGGVHGRGACDDVSGRSHDRQRATLMTANGHLRGRPQVVSPGHPVVGTCRRTVRITCSGCYTALGEKVVEFRTSRCGLIVPCGSVSHGHGQQNRRVLDCLEGMSGVRNGHEVAG